MSLMKVCHISACSSLLCGTTLLTIRFSGTELTESFYLIPSGKEPSTADLKQQNACLKLEIETMQKRLEAANRILQLRKEQDLQLRDSIFQATREVNFSA